MCPTYETILADFRKTYQRWMALVSGGGSGDFVAEA